MQDPFGVHHEHAGQPATLGERGGGHQDAGAAADGEGTAAEHAGHQAAGIGEADLDLVTPRHRIAGRHQPHHLAVVGGARGVDLDRHRVAQPDVAELAFGDEGLEQQCGVRFHGDDGRARRHQIAAARRTGDHHPGHRAQDLGVAQLGARRGQGGARGLQLLDGDIVAELCLAQRRGRYHALGEQRLGVAQVLGGIAPGGGRPVAVGFGLADGAGDVLAVEGGDALPPGHPLALAHLQAAQVGGDARADLDALVGDHGAGGGVVDRQVFAGGDQRGQRVTGDGRLRRRCGVALATGQQCQQEARDAGPRENG
jgi:hypothetical protein